jgi:CubicO group peptidase (beta-lactamase class C family)
LVKALLWPLGGPKFFTMLTGHKQAMAWINNIRGGSPVIMKNGGTAGFGTGIAINPTKDAALFIGMNQAGAQPITKGLRSCAACHSPA